MKVWYELDLLHFNPWSGGKDRYDILTSEQLEQLESYFEEIFPDGCEEAEINDTFWFEEDMIAEYLGFKDWETLEHYNNGDEFIKIKVFNIEWDIDEEDEENNDELPTEVEFQSEKYYEICDDLLDEISDWLSDEYGYCHNSFEVEEIK